MMNKTLAFAMAVAGLAACNRRTGDLASYARSHCSMVADDIREMSERHRTRAGMADKSLSKDQTDAADLELGNLGAEARGVMELALQRELAFCGTIRADKARANKLEDQLHNDLKAYNDSADLQVRAKSLEDMAAAAHELAGLELEGQPDR